MVPTISENDAVVGLLADLGRRLRPLCRLCACLCPHRPEALSTTSTKTLMMKPKSPGWTFHKSQGCHHVYAKNHAVIVKVVQCGELSNLLKRALVCLFTSRIAKVGFIKLITRPVHLYVVAMAATDQHAAHVPRSHVRTLVRWQPSIDAVCPCRGPRICNPNSTCAQHRPFPKTLPQPCFHARAPIAKHTVHLNRPSTSTTSRHCCPLRPRINPCPEENPY